MENSIMSEINDWLAELLMITKPKTIVELGTESGNSTRVFLEYIKHFGATLVSVDIDPNCADYKQEGYTRVIADDVEYAKTYQNGSNKEIDLLFIDTSHIYEHTMKELELYIPLMSSKGIICFHDTNIYSGPLYNSHGIVVGNGWDNKRGVIKAIEDTYFVKIDEKRQIITVTPNKQIIHKPWSGGFTIVC